MTTTGGIILALLAFLFGLGILVFAVGWMTPPEATVLAMLSTPFIGVPVGVIVAERRIR